MNLFGREYERNELSSTVAATEEGRGGLVLIEGSVGVGKSALLDDFEVLARKKDLAVMRAQAAELDQDRPFETLRLALRDKSFRRYGITVEELITELQQGSADLGLGNRLVDQFVDLVEHVAVGGRGAAVVVDDGQWLDVASARVVLALARLTRSIPVIVIVAVRSGDFRGIAPLRSGLVSAGATILPLETLDETALHDLAAERLGSSPSASLREVLRLTGGNPLFAVEILRDERRRAIGDETARVSGRVDAMERRENTDIPDGFRSLVLRRAAQLPDDTRDLLETAALLGASFSLDDLASIRSVPIEDVRAALGPALVEGMVQDRDERMSFQHALVHRVITDASPVATVRDRHYRAGLRLAESGAEPAKVAEQLARAGDGAKRQAAEWAIKAADAARPRSLAASFAWLRRAEQLAEQLAERDSSMMIDVLFRLAMTQALDGQVNGAERTATRLLRLVDDPQQEILARFVLVGALAILGVNRVVDVEREMDWLLAQPGTPDAFRVELISGRGLVLLFAGRIEEALEWADRTRRLDGIASYPKALSRSHEVEAAAAYLRGEPEQALRAARKAVSLFNEGTDAGTAFTIPLTTMATLELATLGPTAASGSAEEGHGFCDRTGHRVAQSHLFTVSALCHLANGDLESAEADVESCIAMAVDEEHGIPVSVSKALKAMFVCWRLGPAEAKARFDDALADYWFYGPSLLRGDHAAYALAETATALGDQALAVSVLRDVWRRLDGQITLPLGPEFVRLSRDADPDFASVVAQAIRARAERSQIPLDGLVTKAATAHYERNVVDLVDSAHAFARVGLRSAAVRTRHAAWILATTHVDVGGTELDTLGQQVREELVAFGATALASGVHQSGEPFEPERPDVQRPRVASALDRLSPTERRVASLVVKGMTNREIGARLYISHRTVEAHLTRVLSKLDVTSRVQVAVIVGSKVRTM